MVLAPSNFGTTVGDLNRWTCNAKLDLSVFGSGAPGIGKGGPLAVGKAEYEWPKIVPREESGPQEIPLVHGGGRGAFRNGLTSVSRKHS